jgi:DNA-binding transcriptional MerR regulator
MNTPKFQYWFFIVFTILYFITLNKFFGISLESIKKLPANELGDFLAGTFSPLAFLFLILGYLQTNKSLGQTSEAITQQAIAIQQQSESLKQQAQSLNTQISELQLANTAYLRQVDEMEKSVAAQQNMFNLAERQYLDTIDEKLKGLFHSYGSLEQNICVKKSTTITIGIDLI